MTKLLLGFAGVIALITAIYFAGANSQKPKIKALEAQVAAITKNRDEWKAARDASEANRKQEAKTAADNLETARQACADSLTAVRQAEAAKRRILARPVTFDAKGCPDRTLIQASEWGPK